MAVKFTWMTVSGTELPFKIYGSCDIYKISFIMLAISSSLLTKSFPFTKVIFEDLGPS